MLPTSYKAILFDFDFTLADSSRGLCEAVNYALLELGYPAASDEAVRKASGMTMQNIFRTLSGANDAEQDKSFVRLFTQKADETMAAQTVLYSGVPDLFQYLQASNIRTGIISTKYRYRIEEIVRRDEIAHHIDIIVGGEDVTAHKPDPQSMTLALQHLNLSPADILYIGDTTIDAETASNVGASFVAVLSGTTPKEDFHSYNPVAILNSVTELVSL